MNRQTGRTSQTAQLLLALCLALFSAGGSAQSLPPPNPAGTQLFVLENGPVTAQFLGGASALFDNELYLSSPANSLGLIFQNHTTPPGTRFDLGTFNAGTELIFRNFVVDTGNSFFTGPGSRNPDGIAHAQVTVLSNADVALFEAFNGLPANFLLRGSGTNPVLLVGFEDIHLADGPDFDYNDLTYLFNNLSSPVPEPSQGLLLLAGLGLVGWLVKRRKF